MAAVLADLLRTGTGSFWARVFVHYKYQTENIHSLQYSLVLCYMQKKTQERNKFL